MAREQSRKPDLKRAVADVRAAQAHRDDVIVDLAAAERARLEHLADLLQPVFDAVPERDEQFSFAVLPGEIPRLWVDATSFVTLARDKQTYRFVKDTRLGRTILAEGRSAEAVGDAVTHYVAERILERERGIEADWLLQRLNAGGRTPEEGARWRSALVGFLLGLVLGIAAILALIRTGELPL